MKAPLRLFLPLFLVFLLTQCLRANEEESFTKERKRMVEEQIEERGVVDKQVLRAMETVPRHLFIPENMRAYSYLDTPLPIGSGQTISQPYIVAFMTEVLTLKKGDKVLEIGTGSGYQAAILSLIVREVHTMEIKRDLAKRAREILQRLGYVNVTVYAGDGYLGLPGEAPFDAIMITAATPEIPPALLDQLGPGGRMVVPVGQPSRTQSLTLITRKSTGEISKEELAPVLFVPLTRD
ncbi:MAG: protein-L-isoaspartate(D-aspartate) O-methyltransferase [Candidatus Brocadiaceae bacterium]|nr:protein-L-isoaspartate(D-aspartate) O-methyltransferase [Candidatus Brocadiaceae bacterium]